MNTRQALIYQYLQNAFMPSECVLTDESEKHRGHAGAASGGGHYHLRITSPLFEGKKQLDRHRLVYDCLHDLMHTEIHALSIVAIAPSEIKV